MEKTFEELLTDDKDFAPHIFGRETVLKLLQQVREATKAEIMEIASRIDDAYIYEAINKLPTDRIKIEK